jgi:hypothetical protein
MIITELHGMVQYPRQLRKAEGGLSGMNTAQAGDLLENLRQENWLRFFRKHLYRFLSIAVAMTVGFPGADAVV